MEVRPFVTKGIALASAGLLVAAVPTIAPPLTPRDVQVAADVQTQLAVANTGFPALPDAASLLQGLQLAANADSTAPSLQQVVVPTLQELVDAFFDGTKTPAGDEVPAGITSVAYLLTKAVLPTAPFVDSFFSGGFVAVTQEFLDFLIPGSTTMTVAPADSETTEDSTVEEPTETAGTTGLFRSDLFGFGLPAVNETINRAASLPGVSTSTQTDEVEESVTEIVAKDETTKDEATKDETTKDETTKDETTKNETTKNETTKDETTKDETTKNETTKNGKVTKDEVTENGKVTDRKVTENGKKFIPGSRDEKKPGAEGNGWGRARDASKNFNGGGASADNNDANAGDDNGTSNEHDS
jgi:hypothetical protein